jgi:hypothetical protein
VVAAGFCDWAWVPRAAEYGEPKFILVHSWIEDGSSGQMFSRRSVLGKTGGEVISWKRVIEFVLPGTL